MNADEKTDLEIILLLQTIYEVSGYDFRAYSKPHIRRRIINRMKFDRMESITAMRQRIRDEKEFLSVLLNDFSVPVTEMFRDADFYRAVRQTIIPVLKTHPFIKIWHAGCSTGEEVYSLAIILKEEGLLERTRIYATDFNEQSLKIAQAGVYTKNKMKGYIKNYRLCGGTENFSNYLTSDFDSVIMKKELNKQIVWANHNLVTDSVFNEMNLILCRNVLIYFTRDLQNKVVKLFYESLSLGGFLGLGAKESLKFTFFFPNFKTINESLSIYQKNTLNS